MKSNLTFILFTYNEEKRISYVIQNFIQYGDVFLLDGGSTDKTKEIAESFGAKFFTRPENKSPFMETQENFDFIKSIIQTDWIYWGYTDNIAPKTLVEKMVEISNQDIIKSVNIPLYTYLWGYTKKYAHKSYAPFLYHKNYIDFKNNYIHGLGKFIGKKDEQIFLENKEKYALKHFSTYTIHKFILGHTKYAETEAQQKYERGEKFSVLKMFAAMLRYAFIYGRYCYKNGTLGLLIVLNYMAFRVITYTKLYELEHNITIENVEENYSKEKVKILTDFK
ncbi:MAG: glycosyltransferase [Candidatus Pacebacteria bacterium]|nr:glycosyltransferase [Candidatus Paceibacterota bacterium]